MTKLQARSPDPDAQELQRRLALIERSRREGLTVRHVGGVTRFAGLSGADRRRATVRTALGVFEIDWDRIEPALDKRRAIFFEIDGLK
jgi:hypothetical protein